MRYIKLLLRTFSFFDIVTLISLVFICVVLSFYFKLETKISILNSFLAFVYLNVSKKGLNFCFLASVLRRYHSAMLEFGI